MRKHFFRNTGKPFEKQILQIASYYERLGILSLEKVDPPTLVKGDTIVYLTNPFLDTLGSWKERGGRMITLECKSSEEPSIAMDQKTGGLTTKQCDNMELWHRRGAVTGVLWECGGVVKYVTVQTIMQRRADFKKQLHFNHGVEVKQGKGFILYDYAENLRTHYSGI